MIHFSVVAQPGREPISIEEVKSYAKIEYSDDDTLLSAMMFAARVQAEEWLGRALITQTVQVDLDFEDLRHPIWLPRPPFVELVKFEVFDENNTVRELASEQYQTFGKDPCRIIEAGTGWSAGRRFGAGRITYRAGYGDTPDKVPAPIRVALLRMVSDMYEHRSDYALSTNVVKMPLEATLLLAPYRYNYL